MKAKRQALIREIVESQCIQTQEELAEALRAHGMVVTQATVSRDIREMHLLKVLADDGSYRYATMEKGDTGVSDRLIRLLSDSVVEMNYANNLAIPYVVFLGEDEIANGVITLKDMTSGEQKTLPVAEAVALLKDGLAQKNAGTVILEK